MIETRCEADPCGISSKSTNFTNNSDDKMKKTTLLTAFAVAAIAGFGTLPAVAQSSDGAEMTEDELRDRFLNQKTRGLVLAPAGGQAATSAATSETSPTQAAATYVELDEAEQVNIQISFDFDSAALRADQKPKLAALCKVIESIDIQLFRIVGHTDASGSASYNDRLSKLRAEEVKRHMVDDCGIEPSRLEAIGVGEAHPFNKANPRADENRRVEFQALS